MCEARRLAVCKMEASKEELAVLAKAYATVALHYVDEAVGELCSGCRPAWDPPSPNNSGGYSWSDLMDWEPLEGDREHDLCREPFDKRVETCFDIVTELVDTELVVKELDKISTKLPAYFRDADYWLAYAFDSSAEPVPTVDFGYLRAKTLAFMRARCASTASGTIECDCLATGDPPPPENGPRVDWNELFRLSVDSGTS